MTHITVPDPDDPNDMPIYDGPDAEAWKSLVPGIYRATDLDGNPGDLTIVPVMPLPDGSGVVPSSAHFAADGDEQVTR